MDKMDRKEIILKTISRDLHNISMTLISIDRKLGHVGQASVSYEYIPDDCPSRQPLDARSQDNHAL